MNPEQPRPTLRGQRIWSSRSVVSKHSIRSYTTSSFEADDELSSADEHVSSAISSNSDDDHDYHTRRRRRTSMPAYSGRDARPTSRKELSGWYMYGFAAETYMICGIGMDSCCRCPCSRRCSIAARSPAARSDALG